MKLFFPDHFQSLLLLILLQIPVLAISQGSPGNSYYSKRSPLILKEHGTENFKEIKQGTFLKIYIHYEGEPADKRRPGANSLLTVFTRTIMFKGQLHGISEDTMRLVHRGKLSHVHIDEIIKIKQYYSSMRRFAGSAINAGGMYLLTLGGILAGLGVKYSFEGDDEDLGSLFFFSGLIIGGAGFFVHRLGLLLRRNKYDLKATWYIDKTINFGG